METKKIIVCDDDAGILEMIAMALEITGYQVILVQDSLNLYKIIEQHSPNLLLIDLWMPVLSGDQVVKVLKNADNTKNIPVLVISASRDGKGIAEDAGADGYIAKPFDVDQLLDKVEFYMH